jgi:Tetratricopeptide repeat
VTQAISQERNPKSEGIPKAEVRGNHPDTRESKSDLAVLCKEQGRYEEADKLLLEAVEGRRLKLGDKHPFTLESCTI